VPFFLFFLRILLREEKVDHFAKLNESRPLLLHAFVNQDLLLRLSQVRVKIHLQRLLTLRNLLNRWVEDQSQDFHSYLFFMVFLLGAIFLLPSPLEQVQLLVDDFTKQTNFSTESERVNLDCLVLVMVPIVVQPNLFELKV